MSRIFLLFLTGLLAGTVGAQSQGFIGGPTQENAFVELLPFPAQEGWTFVSVNRNDSLVFPVFDSIVVRPWECGTGQPFVVLADEKYGLISTVAGFDTLEPFTYDSLFCSGPSFFGRSNGTWLQWSYAEGVKDSTVLGSVTRWYDDGSYLYYQTGGKTGMFNRETGSHFAAVYSYARFFFMRDFTSDMVDDYVLKEYYLVSDGAAFGLSDGEKEVVPVVAEIVQPHGEMYCRYWQNGYWKYVDLQNGRLIDPQGGDVVFYENGDWKIYRPGRTRPTLYTDNGTRTFSGTHEDYFVLDNGMIAVRKDSLIGLTDRFGNLKFDCRCEQLDAVSNGRYRCLQQKKWRLVDANGQTLSAGFDYITENLVENGLFEVHEKGQCGMISVSGKQVLRPVYDRIIVSENLFVLDYNGNLAVANHEGKLLSEPVYSGYDWWGELVVMSKNHTERTVYSRAGKLNLVPCREYFYSDDVLKCYSNDLLEMIVLDEQLNVLERLNYPGVYSFEVGKFSKFEMFRYGRGGRILSHLEEHQQSGLFGYRLEWGSGHIQKPSFREVQLGNGFGYHFGVEEYVLEDFGTAEQLSLRSYFNLQAVDPGAGRYIGAPFASSTLKDEAPGGSSSANRLAFYNDGSRSWWLDIAHRDPAGAVVYIDYPGMDAYRYNTGGAIVPAGQEKEAFSVFDYYLRFNNWQNMVPSSEGIAYVMDPSNRLKVEGGTWYVDHDNLVQIVKMREVLQGHDFESISFYPDSRWRATYFGKAAGQSHYEWAFQFSDSIVLRNLQTIDGEGKSYYTVTGSEMRTGFVHPFNPAFLFVPMDTNTTYAGGRIIFRENDRYGLATIRGEELAPPVFDEIRYLGNGRFGLRNGQEWLLSDRNGKTEDRKYHALGNYENGYMLVIDESGSSVVDTARRVVFKSSSAIFSSGNGMFLQQTAAGKLLFDAVSEISDTLTPAEKDIGNGWIFGKIDEKRYVRRVGTNDRTAVKASVVPEAFGKALVWKEKSAYHMIGPDGKPVVTKKMGLVDVEKGEGIWCFKSPKKWVFVSAEGKLLLEVPKGKNLSWYDGKFIVEHADSVYGIDHFGNRYTMTAHGPVSIGERTVAEKEAGNDIVFSEDGRFGVKSSSGKVLVSPACTAILGKEGEEFVVEVAPGKGVYTPLLKEIVPSVYDEVIPLSDNAFLLRLGQAYGIYSVSGNWIRPFEAR